MRICVPLRSIGQEVPLRFKNKAVSDTMSDTACVMGE